MMKEQEIKDILIHNGYSYCPHSTIYATIKPSVSAYQIGLKESLFANKEHILHFNSKGIVVMPINEMSGKIEENQISLLSEKIIQQKEIRIKPLSFQLIIHTDQGDIEYKIRKSAIGAKWHKKNLSFLLLSAHAK